MGYRIQIDIPDFVYAMLPCLRLDDLVDIFTELRNQAVMIRRLRKLRCKRKPRLPEISFEHVEMDEDLPSGTQEMVEEILAESLFKMWLVDAGHRKEEHEGSCLHPEVN